MATIDILRKSYNQIQSYPLFFFNLEEEWNYITHENEYFWVPEAVYVSEDRYNRISRESIESPFKDVLFAYGKPAVEQPADSADYVRLELEPFNHNDIEHVKAVLLLFLSKAYNATDKYAARELLWMLNSYYIDITTLSSAIDTFDAQTLQPFFWNALQQYSMCLSLPKQRIIQKYLEAKGVVYNIYFPQSLKEALSLCYPNIEFLTENRSIFQLIYLAVQSEKYKGIDIHQDVSSTSLPSNFFLQIRKWLKDEDYIFSDFETLSNLFRLFSPNTQVLLVKRYFHAVKSGHVQFSQDLLRSFQVNKYDNWGIYYHCAHEACKPIRLAVPLLCDNILTFLNSGHTALQTINGTLDMAYAQCDTNSPDVDFGLKHIVPVCNGGAVPNTTHFSGFICYRVISEVKINSFNPDTLLKLFRRYLSIFGTQCKEPACHSDETTIQQCQARNIDIHACDNCISKGVIWLDKYEICLGDEKEDYKRTILKFFTNESFVKGEKVYIEPTRCSISPEETKKRILSWLNDTFKKESDVNAILKDGVNKHYNSGWLIISQVEGEFRFIVNELTFPSWCIIEPRRNAYIGRGVLNKETVIDEQYLKDNWITSLDDSRIQQKENAVILPRIISALNERVDVLPTSNGEYYISYDEELLRKLKSDFYTFKEEANSTTFDDKNVGFMTMARSKYDRYCAPKYENDINLITQLPFMWCRGKECFKTSLGNQTIASCPSWQQFTILHFLEILGYPQISTTPGGNEATELIRSFIGMVNKASSLFRRVRCRECNHILFPLGTSNFNRYNNFECRVPTCGERGKRIYLSQCHNCKSGLIDSRDSAKCPNGWHICPKCLSCCDDNVYERMASKYVLKRIPIPPRISEKLGHGHNDKNQYFCPKCGGEIVTVIDEHTDRIAKVCQQCRALYEQM